MGAWKRNDTTTKIPVKRIASSVTGSVSTIVHLARPAQDGVPRPSQSMNESTSTPSSGTTAKAPKNSAAGSIMRTGAPVRRRLADAPAVPSRSRATVETVTPSGSRSSP